MSYEGFLQRKSVIDPDTGLNSIPALNPMLYEHQRDMVKWALRRGRAALFADCGLGKGPMQMEWADKQPHECIIAAPLAVAHQFVREAEKFGIDLSYAKEQSGITKRLTVTNYERLENFHLEQFGAVALDESSILKNYSGAVTKSFMATGSCLIGATRKQENIQKLLDSSTIYGILIKS